MTGDPFPTFQEMRRVRRRIYTALDRRFWPRDQTDLYFRYGRAAARVGDADAARRAITAAHKARARDYHDDLLEIGGEFGLSRATHHFYVGGILIEIPEISREAITELEQAVSLYAAGPEPGEYHYQAMFRRAGST